MKNQYQYVNEIKPFVIIGKALTWLWQFDIGHRLTTLGNHVLSSFVSISPLIAYRRIQITARDKHQVSVYEFRPNKSKKQLPTIFYCHGGGFSVSAFPRHKAMMQDYANYAKCAVFMIDYRTSLTQDFPVPLFDCLDAIKHITEDPEYFNIDPTRVVIAGDSAGGALASGLIHYINDHPDELPNQFQICGQMLLYPALDCTSSSESMTKFTDASVWTPKLNVNMWQRYFSKGQPEDLTYASPSHASEQHLSKMPPSYIETCEFDPLVDEGHHYAQRISAAGIPTQYEMVEKVPHAYDLLYRTRTFKSHFEKRIKFLRVVTLKRRVTSASPSEKPAETPTETPTEMSPTQTLQSTPEDTP